MEPNPYRSLFLSDLHLGLWGCHADRCRSMLDAVSADHVFLLGDIVEARALNRNNEGRPRATVGPRWRKRDVEALRALQRLVRRAASAIYLPGNHDGDTVTVMSRIFPGLGVRVASKALHTLANGRRVLLFHGDRLDDGSVASPVLSVLGAATYDLIVRADYLLNRSRQALGWNHWGLAPALKMKLGVARRYIRAFEEKAVRLGRAHGADAVVCGHIHTPKIELRGDVVYANSGDWLESCTALAETHSGDLVLMDWRDAPQPAPDFASCPTVAAGLLAG